MIQIPKDVLIVVLIFCFYFAGWKTVTYMIDSGRHRDYLHCQPIQKVETLEEAKARIKQYQERVK